MPYRTRTISSVYGKVLFASTMVSSLLGLGILSSSIRLWLHPEELLRIEADDTVRNNSQLCKYKGLHLCQFSEDLYDFGLMDWVGHHIYYMFGVGALLLPPSLLGMCSILFKTPRLLSLMLILLAISASFDYAAMEVATAQVPKVHKEARALVHQGFIKNRYKVTGRNETAFVLGFNLLMMKLNCCGIHHHTDVVSKPFTVIDDSRDVQEFDYPPACCDFSLYPKLFPNATDMGDLSEEDHLTFMKRCKRLVHQSPRGHFHHGVHERSGCYLMLSSLLNENYSGASLAVLMSLVLFQSVQVIYAIMTILEGEGERFQQYFYEEKLGTERSAIPPAGKSHERQSSLVARGPSKQFAQPSAKVKFVEKGSVGELKHSDASNEMEQLPQSPRLTQPSSPRMTSYQSAVRGSQMNSSRSSHGSDGSKKNRSSSLW